MVLAPVGPKGEVHGGGSRLPGEDLDAVSLISGAGRDVSTHEFQPAAAAANPASRQLEPKPLYDPTPYTPPLRSGLGDETYVPPWLYSKPPHYDMLHARKEFEVCCFSAVKDLLNKTGVSPKQVRFQGGCGVGAGAEAALAEQTAEPTGVSVCADAHPPITHKPNQPHPR